VKNLSRVPLVDSCINPHKRSALAAAVLPCVQLLEDRRLLTAFAADINFQPARSAVPAGYLADTGAVYGDQGNGYSYGWVEAHKNVPVARHPRKPSDGVDDLYDTFAPMHPKGTGSEWQIAVPDGNYQLSITAGDSSQTTGRDTIDLNGTAFLDGKVKKAGGRWISATMQIAVTDGFITLSVPRGRTAKIDFIDISQIVTASQTTAPTDPTPPAPTVFNTAEVIPAAQFGDNGGGVVTEPGGTTGTVIDDAIAGEWVDYSIDVTSAGEYTLSASVANDTAGGSFHAEFGGANVTGAMAVPATGGLSTFSTVTSGSFNLAAGTQTMRIFIDAAASTGTAGNFDDFEINPYTPPVVTAPVEAPYNGTAFGTGQTIPFAQYDLGGQGLGYNVTAISNPGSDTYRAPDPVGMTTGGSTGNVVGYTTAGEWLDYTIDVGTGGSYQLSASAANAAAGGSFHAEVAGVNLSGGMSVPNVGNYTSFQTVTSSSFNLSAGLQVLRIVLDTAATNGAVGNFDTFTLVPAQASNVATSFQPLNWQPLAQPGVPTIEGGSIGVNGKLYVLGGFYSTGDGEAGELDDGTWRGTSVCQVYDPSTNKWSYLAPIPDDETHEECATDGTYIYMAGGNLYNPSNTYQTFATTETWRYDIATNTWSSFVPLPAARGAGSLVLVGDELHFFGGVDVNRVPQATHWELDIDSASPQWVLDTPAPSPRNHVATFSYGGKIYMMGGRDLGTDTGLPVSTCYVFDPSTSAWSQIATMPKPLAVTCYAVVDGLMVIMGGSNDAADPIDTVISYNPATNSWAYLNSFPTAKIGPNGGLVGNQLIVSGGANVAGGPDATTYGAEIIPT
jgi:N-acetylneuraminic acid mutarotase